MMVRFTFLRERPKGNPMVRTGSARPGWPTLTRNILFGLAVCGLGTSVGLGDILTVGAGGDHNTIQAAVDDAVGRGGDHEIRIAQGTFSEAVLLSQVVSGLALSGGWSEAFSSQADDPAATVVSGGDTNRVFDMGDSSGQVSIKNLTVRDGFDGLRGAGVQVSCTGCSLDLIDLHILENALANEGTEGSLNGSAVYARIKGAGSFRLRGCELRDNSMVSQGSATGTIFLSIRDTAVGELVDSTISDNSIVASGSSASGGGLQLLVGVDAEFSVRDNLFLRNVVQATQGSVSGGGCSMTVQDDASLTVTGNEMRENVFSETEGQSTGAGFLFSAFGNAAGRFSDNRIVDNEAQGTGSSRAAGGAIWINNDSVVWVERNQWIGNRTFEDKFEQLSVITSHSSRMIVRDSLVAEGNATAVAGESRGTDSSLLMTNLTVTGHANFPFDFGGSGEAGIFNSVIFDNGGNFFVGDNVDLGNNLVDVDPLFVAPGDSDYRLQAGSPAIDAGTNTPTGGLAGVDLDGNLRISGPAVDIGAYEVSGGPEKVQFLTQMGDGRIGTIMLDTAISVANAGSQGVESFKLSFFQPSADPWALDVAGRGPTRFVAASLAPGQSATFRSGGHGAIGSGYARLEAGSNIQGTGIFTRTDIPSETVLYEAGVPLVFGGFGATLFVDTLGDLETGLAIVNLSASEQVPAGGSQDSVQVRLHDQQFNLLEETTWALSPGRQEALFTSQLFPDSPQAGEMQGLLTLRRLGSFKFGLVTLRQNDTPGVEYPEEVPTLAAFPVIRTVPEPAPSGGGPDNPLILYLAQVGNGQAGTIGLQTSLNLVAWGADRDVRVDFFQSDGSPMVVTLQGQGTGSRFDFSLKTGESVVVQTDGLGDITAGYARLTTLEGLSGSAVFSQIDVPSGILETESGVPSSEPSTAFSLFVDTLGDSDTGLALVNPGPTGSFETKPAGFQGSPGSTATVVLTLLDTAGQQLAQEQLVLEPGEHRARFVSQIFSEVEGIAEMQGLVAVTSDVAVAAVTLKQSDDPGTGFPEDVATLTAFPVLFGSPVVP